MERLALEELLAHQLSHRAIRAQLDTRTAPIIRGRSGLTEKFKSNLGFQLTDAQARVVKEVWHDLSRARPMYRLRKATSVLAKPCGRARGSANGSFRSTSGRDGTHRAAGRTTSSQFR